jgi:hypothetical protein
MSIKNMLTAALFKQRDDGRMVVYPNGAMGRGYILPDAATEQKMRSALMWLVVGSGLFGGIGMQILIMRYGQLFEWGAEPWIVGLMALAVFCLAYRMLARMMMRGMPPVRQRMGMVEAMKRQAEAMPRWYLWFMVVVAPLCLVGSVACILAYSTIASLVLGLLGVVLFASATAQAVHGLQHRGHA